MLEFVTLVFQLRVTLLRDFIFDVISSCRVCHGHANKYIP